MSVKENRSVPGKNVFKAQVSAFYSILRLKKNKLNLS